jgi:hypothetical protein
MISQFLTQHIRDLRDRGYSVEVVEADNFVNIVITDYPLPDGFNKKTTALLIRILPSYPNGKPDMFWVDEDLVLAAGTVPQSAETIEEYLGKKWRRFSWHLADTAWNPGTGDLLMYLEFINRRFLQNK